MARRKLSHHQEKRITGAQHTLSQSMGQHRQGLVISHHGGKIVVEWSDGLLAECTVKSNLGAIVCGDRVVCEHNADTGSRVLAVRPRDNLLQRLDGFGHSKSVAANISQLLICLAVKPEPNRYLLDQYLFSAEQQAIQAVIVLNKVDLLKTVDADPFELESIYARLGYPVLQTSMKTMQGIDQLKALLKQNTTVISGVSGVGKSSISAVLLPFDSIKTAEISTVNKEGRHTTRTSRLYRLPNQAQLIDTPGVRGFKPLVNKSQQVSTGFREIHNLQAHCRFANCTHTHEPKCAVIAALHQGEIADSRYRHYLDLFGSD